MDEPPEYFDLLPQHKRLIKEVAQMVYRLDISDEEIDQIQQKEGYINFNSRQSDYLRRSLVIQKLCEPLLQENIQNVSPQAKKFFDRSLVGPYFYEAKQCFRTGLLLSTIGLCRSSLEVCLREAIAYQMSKENKTSVIREYSTLKRVTLGDPSQRKGLIYLAREIITEEEINKIFSLLYSKKGSKEIRKLLDKFIHGSYSELFGLAKGITFGSSQPRDFEDLIGQIKKFDTEAGMNEVISPERTFFNLVMHERVALNFLLGLFTCVRLVYYERMNI